MNGRKPKKKWKKNQSTKINLIGCDTIVNSPSPINKQSQFLGPGVRMSLQLGNKNKYLNRCFQFFGDLPWYLIALKGHIQNISKK